MREIETHKVNGLNEAIEIVVLDEPGAGGASSEYSLYIIPPESQADGSVMLDIEKTAEKRLGYCIKFQKGPIAEAGVNGISNEALLAIVADRLECFQKGPFPCDENAAALAHILGAMQQLSSRTRDRVARNVEGTSAK